MLSNLWSATCNKPPISMLQTTAAGAQQLTWPTVRRHNPLNIFAAHEITGFVDPSVATKMTVHFNLFGGVQSEVTHTTPIPVSGRHVCT